MNLSSHEREILEALDATGGFLTRRVAEKVTMFGSNARQHSGAVRSWLVDLKNRGLVDFLDDQKPVCWKRTPAGTAALAEAERIDAEYAAIHRTALARRYVR